MAERVPRPGEFYRHFKNKMYQIVTVAEHSETGEALVIYQALYGDFRVYARPLDLFVGEVDHDKYPRAAQKFVFEQVLTAEGATDREEKNNGRGPEPQHQGKAFADQEQEKQARLNVWKETDLFSDHDDYEEAETLSGQESVVIPRDGRAAGDEDALWESLTDEVVKAAGEAEAAETETVSPKFLDFLEARTYESKAVILESMREELDDEMIDGLAMAVDVEIPEGPIEGRYHQLEQCLRTMAKYEDTRLR